ncbi:glycosyltransferase family 39 protein [Leptolyngbya sp. FACHB-36]|uniref:ArnT family glycosyltransferase n=1 Tax=Leptolyngbya sp. FACHB-36 TaxID=2692808 RepID=UPI00322025E7
MSASINRLWKRYPAIARVAPVIWLLAIAGVVLVWNVGAIGLIDETEPLFVEAARQMNSTSDWITPYFNNETRFDKPPLIYWLMVAAFKLFGVSEWSARLPSVLSALALTLILFYTVRRVGSGQTEHLKFSPFLTPWLAATMLLLNPNTFFWGRTGYSDMLLNACIGGSLLTFFLGYAQSENRRVQQRWYLTFYVLIALAVLTKGPIGILLPGLIIGSFLLYIGNGGAVLREMQLVWGAGLVAVLSVPWYVLVTLANGEAFINSFFGYHNVERFATVVNRHAGPWYFHILVILVGFLPWSVYLPAAIARLKPLQRRQWQTQPRAQQLGIFALCWFGCILGFFTIATTKYFSYTLPLMPAAAILVALLWTDYLTHSERGWGFVLTAAFNVALLAALAAAIVYSPQWLGDDPWMPNLGARLQASGLPVLGGVIWGAAAIAAIVALLRRSRWLWLVNLLGFLAFLIVVMHPMVLIADAERQLPLRQIAQTATQVERPGEPLIMVGFKKPSLVFYTQRSVTYLPHPADARTYLQSAARSSVLLVAGEKTFAEIGLAPAQYQTIKQETVYRLVRVLP